MKWIGITGSWRVTSDEVEKDVRDFVRQVVERGDGIVAGGALNVDYFATDEALKYDAGANNIKVFIPTTLDRFSEHYRKRASEGIIAHSQAESLIAQLTNLKEINTGALIENPSNQTLNTESYYVRNLAVVNASNEIAAFQVNESKGTQDTIDKARAQNKHVVLKQYTIK
jgi:hypothetical protein